MHASFGVLRQIDKIKDPLNFKRDFPVPFHEHQAPGVIFEQIKNNDYFTQRYYPFNVVLTVSLEYPREILMARLFSS